MIDKSFTKDYVEGYDIKTSYDTSNKDVSDFILDIAFNRVTDYYGKRDLKSHTIPFIVHFVQKVYPDKYSEEEVISLIRQLLLEKVMYLRFCSAVGDIVIPNEKTIHGLHYLTGDYNGMLRIYIEKGNFISKSGVELNQLLTTEDLSM